MQSIDLNLATRPFRNNTVLWVGLLVAMLSLALLSVWNVQRFMTYDALVVDLEDKIGGLEERAGRLEERERLARREIEKHDLVQLATQTEKANEVLRWKSFSWTRLFNLLQDVQPWDVQMGSIHPVFRADTRASERSRSLEDVNKVPVSVEGVARTLEDFFAFEKALILDPHFDRVDPEGTDVDDVTGEIAFRLRFMYDPRVGMGPAILEDESASEDAPSQPGETPLEAPAETEVEATDRVAEARTTDGDGSGEGAR